MPSENNSRYQQGQAPSSIAAPSLPICRKHQPSPSWALAGLPCVLGKQKGTTGPQQLGSREIKEPCTSGGEKEKGRLLTARTSPSRLGKQPVPGKFSDSAFCGQVGIHPWRGGSSNTPSPLLSLSTETGGCRASPEKLALHYPICCSVLPGKE